MKNKFISILLASLLAVSAVIPVQAADTFTDVPQKYWAHDAIEEMADQGIVSGTGNGKFSPNSYVTTAQFVSMLMRMFYGTELTADHGKYSLWYEKVMDHAADHGILYQLDIDRVWGYGKGAEQWKKNMVNSPMYRKEMAVMVYNYLKQNVALPTEDTLRHVTAAGIPDLGNNATVFEQYAIASVYEMGCLTGTDQKGTFGGNLLMTRAQACVVLSALQDIVRGYHGGTTGADWVKAVENGSVKQVLKEATLVNGLEKTEYNVASRLNELRKTYPQGMSCTDENFHYIDPSTGEDTGNTGCYALAMYVFDYVFGYGAFYKAKATDLTEATYGTIKPGDHIRIEDLPHSVIVLEVNNDHLKVMEGNFNKQVYWDNTFTKAELMGYQDVTIYSCY